jgi:hypothetical protein
MYFERECESIYNSCRNPKTSGSQEDELPYNVDQYLLLIQELKQPPAGKLSQHRSL